MGLIGTAGDTGGTSGVGLIMIGVSIMGIGGLMIKQAPIARPVSDDCTTSNSYGQVLNKNMQLILIVIYLSISN